MIKELEQYVKDKIELESEVLSLKDTVRNQNHTIRNLKKRLEDEHPRVEIIKKNLTYYVRTRKPIDWNMIKTMLKKTYDSLCNHDIDTAVVDLKYMCEYLYIQEEEQIEEESFINLEEVEKRIEDKLEKKYEKELQKLSTSALRIKVLEEYVRDCRSKVDRYEKQIEELEEELVDCSNRLGGVHVDLDELRSHYNKLKNHWLVKLLRL